MTMNKLRILMRPNLGDFEKSESGIKRVVEAYYKYADKVNIEFVQCHENDTSLYDVLIVHAGTTSVFPNEKPLVSMLHGLYWTADYSHTRWELEANAFITASIRHADVVTVPSAWVAETIRRDLRLNPIIIPHGIDYWEWENNEPCEEYVLWNKNRVGDVCSPHALGELAVRHPKVRFLTTFRPDNAPGAPNIRDTGVVPSKRMKVMIQRAAVYLSTTKETFGIGILEAMASGIPVLGFDHGGNRIMVQHGVNGYLASPGNYEDLSKGLEYCLQHRAVLGANGKELAKNFSWEKSIELVRQAADEAVRVNAIPPAVSVVIPSYNYSHKVGRAIQSALDQTYKPEQIIVVDDGSPDDGATKAVVEEFAEKDSRVKYIRQLNAGVAVARNTGVYNTDTKYFCCLDADDAIEPDFLGACVEALEEDKSVGLSFTRLRYIKPDGETGVSEWPGIPDYNDQLKRKNQVPTCCVIRREVWDRLGGYRQRYAPLGAGSEDAEFWTRVGAYGWDFRLATDAAMFVYSWQSGMVSGNPEYREVDWLYWHPWTRDGQHPFASIAKPANRSSHLVRQYDEPDVSIIIPVRPGHEEPEILWRALDSVDGQTFRGWECIVVFDGVEENDHIIRTKRAFPHVKYIHTDRGYGAGYARNRGAEIAQAPLLLFLDADDWLVPEAVATMVDAYVSERNIIYTDYAGKALIPKENLKEIEHRLIEYNDKTGEAVLKHQSADYNCELAIVQPEKGRTYIWCLVTSLVPRAWHKEIGGFDESMESWEDWDYWIRMARAGKCFTRVREILVVYRFYTGSRRDEGLKRHKDLIQYLQNKYKGDKPMPCNCGGRRIAPPTQPTRIVSTQRVLEDNMAVSDSDLVLVRYMSPNRGQHMVVGGATKRRYGYRGGGEVFYVDRRDISAQPGLFQVITSEIKEDEPRKEAQAAPQRLPGEIKEKVLIVSESTIEEIKGGHLAMIPGATEQIVAQFEEAGITTYEQLQGLGVSGLRKFKGVGEARAKAIMAFIEQALNESESD